jgi:glycosyltransferase involved in cell wall biosynthesis
MPRLSVILPNYNHAAELPRALDALLSQCRPADEILVVDDGSIDDSWDVLTRYARGHDAVVPLRHASNRGVTACVTTATAACTGDWIYGAGADDAVLPGWFRDAMAMVERHPRAGVVLGDVISVYDDHRRPERQRLAQWADEAPCYLPPARVLAEHLRVDPAGFSLGASALFRRDALEAAGGFRPELGSWCDTFLTRVLALRHGMIYLARPAVRWTASAHSYSHRIGLDRQRMQQIGERAAALMRGEFADLFPEDDVRRFETRWMLEMAGGYDCIGDTLVPRRLRDIRRAYADVSHNGAWFDRLLGGALRCMFRFSDRRRARKFGDAYTFENANPLQRKPVLDAESTLPALPASARATP